MSVVNLKDFRIAKNGKAKRVTFYGPAYCDVNLQMMTPIVEVLMPEGGDMQSIFQQFIAFGGIPYSRDGVECFLPWPCASIEMRDMPPDEAEALRTQLKPGEIRIQQWIRKPA
jgi:hypothetical protein